jgi:carbon-monoxide dehydrogenase medium subunit
VDAEAIAELALTETAPFNDKHASAEYRRTVGRRILARALREALALREAA